MNGLGAITKASLDNYILAQLDTNRPAERAAEALADARKQSSGPLTWADRDRLSQAVLKAAWADQANAILWITGCEIGPREKAAMRLKPTPVKWPESANGRWDQAAEKDAAKALADAYAASRRRWADAAGRPSSADETPVEVAWDGFKPPANYEPLFI